MPHKYEYTIIRYVPDVVRDEAVNVGVLVRDFAGTEFHFRLRPRTTAVHGIAPTADGQLVANFRKQLMLCRSGQAFGAFGRPTDPKFFSRMQREFVGNLQITAPRGLTADSLDQALTRLFKRYVAEPSTSTSEALAPTVVRRRLVSVFKRHDLIGPNRLEPNFRMTGSHAEWQFDLGGHNGRTRLIQSVALNSESEEKNLSRALVLKGMLDEVRLVHQGVIGSAVVTLASPGAPAPGVDEAQGILKDAADDVVNDSAITSLVDTVARDFAFHGAEKSIGL
jgi:hypothetical protein